MSKFLEIDITTADGGYAWIAKDKVESVKVRKISNKIFAVEAFMPGSIPKWHFDEEKEAYEFAYALIAKLEGDV